MDDIARLREALREADYTGAGIAARIGATAVEAVRRNDFRALLRMTAGGDRLATLIRLFLAGRSEPADAVAAALAPLPLPTALAAGLVGTGPDGVHAGMDLDVYHDRWVLSDVDVQSRPGPMRGDHVLGVGNAATTLAGATIRRPVGTALDVGTGCGVQALELSAHAQSVTATDLTPRALRFAATTAALNGLSWELLEGDLLAPVAGRRFDLVVSNPPFVVGPGATRYAYRDSGRAGDGICAELAASAPAVLADGGTLQFLANWLHVTGEDWHERVAGWVPPGCDAWIVQREVSDPVEYVHLWLRDASEAFDPIRAQEWLDWFDTNKIAAVGYGMVTIRRSGREDPVVRVEDLRHSVSPPFGDHIGAWFDRQNWLATHPDLLSHAFVRAEGLTLTQEARHDGDDWAVDRQLLVQPDGLRWTEEVDPVALALVSGADGTVPMRDQIAVLASAFDTSEAVLAAMAVPVVTHLVERGFVIPGARSARAGSGPA
jgi:methylase of polypeptide subunit release factors